MKQYETPEAIFHLAEGKNDCLIWSSETGDAYQDDKYNDDFGFIFHF